MRLIDARSGLEILDRQDCLRLLRDHERGVGRIALVDGRHPVILPVNYALDDDRVVFRTAAGTKLDGAVHNAPVAFEVDEIDEERHGGWSVLVKGRAERMADTAGRELLDRLPELPWAPGEHPTWVVIHPDSITGRRLAPSRGSAAARPW